MYYLRKIDYVIVTALVTAVYAGPTAWNLLAPDLPLDEKTEVVVVDPVRQRDHLRSEAYDFAPDNTVAENPPPPEEDRVLDPTPAVVVALQAAPRVSENQGVIESEVDGVETKHAVIIATANNAEPLEEILNVEEVDALEALVAEGQALISDGANYPAYTADLPQTQLASLLKRGMAKLVVTAGTDHLFTFPGALLTPGRARLACRSDFAGFSARALFINGSGAREMVRRVSEEFNFARHKLAAAVVLRADIDAAVLASQRRAAQDLDLSLDDVRLTDGEFLTASGLPWRYRVNRVCLGDGQCLTVERSSLAAATSERGGG